MLGAQKEELRIENYSLWEFCSALEKAILQGYTLDLDSNEGFPQQIGTIFTCKVYKVHKVHKVVKEVEEQVQSVEQPEPEVKKVGRKPKVVVE